MMRKIKNRIIFFANIPIKNEERSIGGATVLAKSILDFLKKNNNIEVEHIQIRSFWRNKLQLIDYFLWLFKFPFILRNKDVVSFHGTKDFHFTIAPILCLWARLLNKRIIYHFFGGVFHHQYEKLSKPMKFIIKSTILKSDTVFFETIQLIEYFKKEGFTNGVWLPNSRESIFKELPNKKFSKKFVFISRVIPQKGVNEIMQAAQNLNTNYTIDLYGPIDDRHYPENLFEQSKANYKGVLNPDEVISTLKNYDVLLLPSYFEGEGYPGIIIESLALGIPVIATHWIALPEIVKHQENGLLIDIKNAKQLQEAILYINETNYPDFAQKAFKSFENFENNQVFNKIIKSYID